MSAAQPHAPAPLPGEEVHPRRREAHPGALFVENVSVSFDGFKALDDLTLYVDHGELRCLIGPNGAGKTTLMDVITGRTRPDTGEVFFGDRLDLLRASEAQIAQAGIGRKFQKPTVFEQLCVQDNLVLALRQDRRVRAMVRARLSGAQRDRLDEVADLIGLADARTRPAGTLSHGQKQWLEIGMLLLQEPRLLLIDEPVAGMTRGEIERTAQLLQELAGERSVVVVEHDMEFVRAIARRVTVLHQGHVLAEGTMAQVQADPRVIEVYLGE
jgi:urea transport system ATP-binding protein